MEMPLKFQDSSKEKIVPWNWVYLSINNCRNIQSFPGMTHAVIRATKYDLVVLIRTEYKVVLGCTGYKYDKKRSSCTCQYGVRAFYKSEVVLVRLRTRYESYHTTQ